MFQKSVVIILLTMGYICSCSNSSNSSLQNGESELNQSLSPQQNKMSKPLPKTDTIVQSIENTKHGTVLVVGDSLSAAYGMTVDKGWVHLLSQRLTEKNYAYQVVNASISGDTTSGGVSRLLKAIKQYTPEIVVLELGANDGLRALNLQKMRQNLAIMIEKSQQSGAKVLLLGMRIPPNYGKAYTEDFHQIYHELATKYAIPLIPFFLEGIVLNQALIQADGLHPNENAQPRLLKNVWEELEKLL